MTFLFLATNCSVDLDTRTDADPTAIRWCVYHRGRIKHTHEDRTISYKPDLRELGHVVATTWEKARRLAGITYAEHEPLEVRSAVSLVEQITTEADG